MIDSSFADRDSACTMQLLIKAGGDSDSMARLTGFVSMLQHKQVVLDETKSVDSDLQVCNFLSYTVRIATAEYLEPLTFRTGDVSA